MSDPIIVSTQETIIERLSETDKNLLEQTKLKSELARAYAKTAIAQSESAELTYNNVVLQLAMKYHLEIGSIIKEDGTIQRNNPGTGNKNE